MKNSLLSATSLASVTYTPSIAARPASIAAPAPSLFARRTGAGGMVAVSLATALATQSAPASAAVIFSTTGTNLSGTNFLIGDTVSGGAGYTLITGSSITASLTTKNLNAAMISTAVTAVPGTIGLNVTGVPASIAGNATDAFNVRVTPTVRGAASSTFTYSAWGAGGFTSTAKDSTVYTVQTTGVAPLANVTASQVYVLAGSGSKATTSVVISNIGDGNLATSLSTTTTNLSAGTNSVTLGSAGWSGSVANTGALADSNSKAASPVTSSSAGTLTYTAQASRGSSAATVTSAFTNASNVAGSVNKASTTTTLVVGTTVAPVASVTSSVDYGQLRAGTSAAAAITVQNTGDGNLAGKTSTFNLGGSVAAATGTFKGAGGTLNGATGLNDSNFGGGAVTSATYSFTYAPTARGSDSTNVTTTLSNGLSNKNAAGTLTTALSGTAVGPDYGAALNTAGNPISSGATVSFGDAAAGVTKQSLLISNISKDNASTALTNMTITAQIIGDAASEFSFSLSGFFSGNAGSGVGPMTAVLRNAFNSSDLGTLAVQFVSKSGGNASAQLRIQTDEESALGTMGSSIYVYNLIGTVPEPGTMMVLGTGLLGLAITRRNRRGKTEAVALTANGADQTGT